MKELNISSVDELKSLIQTDSEEVTDSIVDSISEAFKFQKDNADIFRINFDNSDIAYDISLPKSQWITALEKCLDNYHNFSCSDKAIDTYLLLKEIKAWQN